MKTESSLRVAAALTELPELALRAADSDDADLLLCWRNDPATRSASFTSGEIQPAEHSAWLERKLGDPRTRILIAVGGGVPIGQLRLEQVGQDVVEVHIALAAEARGRGFAAALLTLAGHHARELGAKRIIARVKPDNEPSRRAFQRAGFRVRGGRDSHSSHESGVAAAGSPSELHFELVLGAVYDKPPDRAPGPDSELP